jgi:hypothetical protein
MASLPSLGRLRFWSVPDPATGAGVQTQAQHRLAKDVQLYAAVTLLAVQTVVAVGIRNADGFLISNSASEPPTRRSQF